jgi:hypothetical protein
MADGGWRIGVVALLIVLAVGTAAEAARAEVIDRVLAVVGGELIMLSDVQAARDLGLASPGQAADPVREVLSRLIDRQLQLAEVERYAPREPTVEEVDRELDRVQARFQTAEAFEAALGRSGLDRTRLRDRLRDDLRIQAYLEQRFSLSDGRRQRLIDDWIAGLRRRAVTIDLYVVGA